MQYIIELFRSCFAFPELRTRPFEILGNSGSSITQGYKYVNKPLQFVFVGVSGCGKSTAIKNIFGITRPETTTQSAIQVYEVKTKQTNIDYNVVDVPGLQHENSADENATIITNLKNYLCKSSPNNIPTILFITASLNDNRFEGELSDFSQFLRALLYLKYHLFDEKYHNVILVLTNADQPDVSANLEVKQERYVLAFSKVFKPDAETIPVVITVSNAPILVKDFKALLAPRTHNPHYHFFHDNYAELQNIETQSCQPINLENADSRLLSFLVNDMNSNNVPDSGILTENIMSNNTSNSPLTFKFRQFTKISIKIAKEIHKELSIPRKGQLNFFYPCTEIILANGDKTDIADCFVGTRILSYGGRVATVTKILRINVDQKGKKVPVGPILLNPVSEQCSEVTSPWYMTYNTDNGTNNFKAIRNFINPFTQKKSKEFFYMEADYGNSTFVANGYVQASK